MVQLLLRTVWNFLIKLNINLPYDPANPLLNICPGHMKVRVYPKPYIRISITDLIITAKPRNNSNIHQEVNVQTNCDIFTK